MKISVLMVDGNFREKFHLLDSLSTQNFPREDYEVIWVEFYSDVKKDLQNKRGVKIVTLGKPGNEEYHSSLCFNEGIRRSKGEIVVIPDADVVVDPDFLETVYAEHLRCEKLVLYFRRWNELHAAHDELKSYSLEHLKSVVELRNPTNYGGCLTVRKKWLLEINGYEEDLVFSSGFHANGLDVYSRLNNLGLHIMWHPTKKIYHPWHPGTAVAGSNYEAQHSIIKKRQINLSTLPNSGLDPAKNKAEKELPDAETETLKKGIIKKIKRIIKI